MEFNLRVLGCINNDFTLGGNSCVATEILNIPSGKNSKSGFIVSLYPGTVFLPSANNSKRS